MHGRTFLYSSAFNLVDGILRGKVTGRSDIKRFWAYYLIYDKAQNRARLQLGFFRHYFYRNNRYNIVYGVKALIFYGNLNSQN